MKIRDRVSYLFVEKPRYVVILWLGLIAFLGVLLVIFVIPSKKPISKQPAASNVSDIHKSPLGPVTDAMQVSFVEKNKSGESGNLTLQEINGKVYLEVALTGNITKEPQPAFVYEGSCDKPDRQLYSLSPVVNGKTANYLTGSLADFKKQFPLALRVHKANQDTKDTKNDVACVDLKV